MKVQSGLCRCSLRLTAGGVLLWAAFLVPCRAELLENVRYSESSSAAVSAGSRATALVRKLRPAETIPVVDGRLDDACWQRPSAYLGKFRLGLTPVPAQHTREAWATYDSESLFIAVRLQREPGTALRVQTREPDNGRIWEDDEFEIFVDPFATGTAYYQMIMNSAGVLFDAAHRYRIVPDPGGASPNDTKLERESDTAWNSGLRCRVAVADSHWSAEVALPLAALRMDGAPAGHTVRFNITSADWDTREYTCLSPTSDWHDPQQFGALILGEPQVKVEALQLHGVGTGANRLSARVTDLSGHPGSYVLTLNFAVDDVARSWHSRFTLPAAGSRTVACPFNIDATAGAWVAKIRIAETAGSVVYLAQRAGELPRPLTLRLGSRAALAGARPVAVGARLGVGSVTAPQIGLQARLLAAGGDVVATQDLGQPSGTEMTACLPLDTIAPGRYRLELRALRGTEILAQAVDSLTVGASPFARAP